MSRSIHCQCGQIVPYLDEDRGHEVYCPSCARAVLIPPAVKADQERGQVAQSPPAPVTSPARHPGPPASPHPKPAPTKPTAPRAASVPGSAANSPRVQGTGPTSEGRHTTAFGRGRASALHDRIVERIVCTCGETNSVTLRQYGRNLVCIKCGEPLTDASGLRPRQIAAVAAADVGPVMASTRVRFVRSPMSVFVVLLIFAATAALGMMVWSPPEVLSAYLKQRQSRVPGGHALEEAAAFDPEHLRLEMIDALTEESDPFQALILALGWKRGLLERAVAPTDPRILRIDEVIQKLLAERHADMLQAIRELSNAEDPAEALHQARSWDRLLDSLSVEVSDARRMELQQVMLRLVERTDPITLMMIDDLLNSEKPADALVQVSLWREALFDRKAQSDDQRFARLDAVAAELKRRLTPRPKSPPPWIAEFQSAVQELADGLRTANLPRARKGRAAAESLLQAHTDDLAPHSARFVRLRMRLNQMELRIEGRERVESLLADVERLLDGNDPRQVNEALELRARAKFTCYHTPLEPLAAEALVAKGRALIPKAQFALGKRAVADAEALDREGKKGARDAYAQKARSLLAGLPESDVRPYLKSIESWGGDAFASSVGSDTDDEGESGLHGDLRRRDLIEEALEHYGEFRSLELLSVARTVRAAHLKAGMNVTELDARLGNLVLDVLETRLANVLDGDARDLSDRLLSDLLTARETLDEADAWKSLPRWITLDGALRQKGNELSQKILDDALRLAASDQLPDAVTRADVVTRLTSGDLASRAMELKEQWQQELHIRAERQAEEDAWQEIVALGGKKSRQPKLLLATELFLRRYPQSKHAEAARKRYESTRDALLARFDEDLSRLKKVVMQQAWTEAVPLWRQLGQLPQTDAQKSDFASLGSELMEVRKKTFARLAKADFKALTKTNSPDHIQEVQGVVELALLFDPEHEDAQQLLSDNRAKATKVAEKLLAQAQSWQELLPDKARKNLELVIQLDSDGKSGIKAREILEEMQKKE